jgi:Flp pilus assembly protein TadG
VPGRYGFVRARPRHDRESGQALLELALVVPILALLALAIFQFAYVIESQMGLTNAVREAARRVAATDPNAAPAWNTTMRDYVVTQLCGTTSTTPPCPGGLLDENVQGFEGARVTGTVPNVSFCRYTVGTSTTLNYRVIVSVAYQHPLFFGFLDFATDLVDGTPGNNAWDIGASAEMRLENIDPSLYTVPDPGACP